MAHGINLQIDDQTERLLRERARRDGISIEEEARKLLTGALRSDWDSFWARVDRVREGLSGQSFPDSTELIREDRDR